MKHKCSSYVVHQQPVPVILEWEDPASSAGWVEDIRALQAAHVHTCTYAVAQCDHFLWVAREYHEEAGKKYYADLGVYPHRVLVSLAQLSTDS